MAVRTISYRMVTMGKYRIEGWTDEDCAQVTRLFDVLSGKYTMLLVAILALEGEKNFGQLKRDMQPISSKTLAARLRHLERHGLITNRRITDGKVKLSYYGLNKNDKEVLAVLRAFRGVVGAR